VVYPGWYRVYSREECIPTMVLPGYGREGYIPTMYTLVR